MRRPTGYRLVVLTSPTPEQWSFVFAHDAAPAKDGQAAAPCDKVRLPLVPC